MYVRRGFAELLAVALIGAALWYYLTEAINAEQKKQASTRLLFCIFAIELTVLTFFSQHKLVIQQLIFGFRDQRLFASCGVLLLSITFVLFALRIYGYLNERQIFSIQYLTLFGMVAFLSVVNMELQMNRIHPIQFEYAGKRFKDYAYLLTNSYDNYQEWDALIAEAELTGVPIPKDYYWGGYTSLCGHPSPILPTALSKHYGYLYLKYGEMMNKRTIKSMMRFNLNEYKAFQLIQSHAGRFISFEQSIATSCGKRLYSTQLGTPTWTND